ncbi:DUF2306 domain-containing protein [Kibdelosporangium phytohabitans]|uniref:DUF2306 domain-containing protein n=1 Tax=Kibdelosporangium phytohabitans TaxID=860235 RepID=A0A0N7F3M3_9PSEU|nr:DUF2306 domain-containing protein [Kibdelosporangium phytohabitans]ALG09031.1 hypothetical protein AOZ06_20805 [Kibdelosporangium phytohabitans]MBE1469786.1 putative membrane protein [Kibdelosporangium phytohabitans]
MTNVLDETIGSSPAPGRKWWRKPWIVPLGFIAVAFIAFSLPRYLTFDRAQSRVQQPEFGWHYPLLVIHVTFASIAMLTCVLQVWPWFRARYRHIHRLAGRIYVFGGVFPAGVTALVIGVITPFGPAALSSGLVMAPLWLLFTYKGYRVARRRLFVDHRKWMIRSFALTMSIITNRVWAVVFAIWLGPQFDTTFMGNEKLFGYSLAGATTWLGWVIPLLIAEWWLQRDEVARRRAKARV